MLWTALWGLSGPSSLAEERGQTASAVTGPGHRSKNGVRCSDFRKGVKSGAPKGLGFGSGSKPFLAISSVCNPPDYLRIPMLPKAKRKMEKPTMVNNAELSWITNYIWGIADDVLRDLYVRGKYRDVI